MYFIFHMEDLDDGHWHFNSKYGRFFHQNLDDTHKDQILICNQPYRYKMQNTNKFIKCKFHFSISHFMEARQRVIVVPFSQLSVTDHIESYVVILVLNLVKGQYDRHQTRLKQTHDMSIQNLLIDLRLNISYCVTFIPQFIGSDKCLHTDRNCTDKCQHLRRAQGASELTL